MLSSVVCMKVTVDTAQLKADPRTSAPALAAAPLRISTFDEHALEEAVRLKEKHGGRVIVLSLVAEKPPPDLILRALAMGADEAHLVVDPSAAEADALATATTLAAALRTLDGWDLVFCGDGSIDQYSRQVGPRIAEELGILPLTQVTHLEVESRGLVARRGLEETTETVEAELPALVTVGQEINRPRFPTVLQIMGASRKPVHEKRREDLGLPAAEPPPVETLEIAAPSSSRKKIVVTAPSPGELAAELARNLLAEGVVGSR